MGEANTLVLRSTLFAEQVGCFLSGQAYFFQHGYECSVFNYSTEHWALELGCWNQVLRRVPSWNMLWPGQDCSPNNTNVCYYSLKLDFQATNLRHRYKI